MLVLPWYFEYKKNQFLLAYSTRFSKRTIKLKKNEEFDNGEKGIKILRDRNARGSDVWHQRTVQYSTSSDNSTPPFVNMETYPVYIVLC